MGLQCPLFGARWPEAASPVAGVSRYPESQKAKKSGPDMNVRVSAYAGTVGHRSKPQGSPTEFNRQIGADLGEIPLVAEATSTVRSGGLTIPLAVRESAAARLARQHGKDGGNVPCTGQREPDPQRRGAGR
jgi:hypothetical protein